jgi:hypothetical protein
MPNDQKPEEYALDTRDIRAMLEFQYQIGLVRVLNLYNCTQQLFEAQDERALKYEDALGRAQAELRRLIGDLLAFDLQFAKSAQPQAEEPGPDLSRLTLDELMRLAYGE